MIRLAIVALLMRAGTLAAQPLVLTPREVGMLADAVLEQAYPPARRLSTLTVRARGIVFDAALSDSSLRGVRSTATPASLGMRSQVVMGNHSVLSDCREPDDTRCAILGNRVYVYLFRESLDDGEGRTHI